MRGLDATNVLRLFERGHDASVIERGLLLLEHAWPDSDAASRMRLPLAERDRLLTALRVLTLGPTAGLREACPGCGAVLDADLDLQQILDLDWPKGDPLSERVLHHKGRKIRYRLPGSEDFAAAIAIRDRSNGNNAAELAVLQRCIASREANTEVLPAFSEAVATSDPLTEVDVRLQCQDCDLIWSALFDIVSFFWTELETYAVRLFREIDVLARTYGWTEHEILRLGPERRNVYLGMVMG